MLGSLGELSLNFIVVSQLVYDCYDINSGLKLFLATLYVNFLCSPCQMALGIELPMKQLGYLSVIEFMSAMADIVTIERPTASDWLLFDARIQRNTAKPGLYNPCFNLGVSIRSI